MTAEPTPDKDTLSRPALAWILGVEGFISISLEILSLRQLTPYAGNSVIVTSTVIGFFILALAFGYAAGGARDRGFLRALNRNFVWSGYLLVIGLSHALLSLLFFAVRNAGLAMALYSVFIVAPAAFLLGQTVPTLLSLARQTGRIGEVTGRTLFLSNLGSFAGSIGTAALMLPFAGVSASVAIVAVLAASLIVCTRPRGARAFVRPAIHGAALVGLALGGIALEHRLYAETNEYASYAVFRDRVGADSGLVFSVNGSRSSGITSGGRAFPYVETMKRVLLDDLAFRDKDILVLGAGGFSLSAERTNGNRFEYVDIDPDLPRIVHEHFLPRTAGTFVVADARAFLRSTPRRYDAVVSDVYGSAVSIPYHLLTVEYFGQIRHVLRPGGVVLVNAIARPTFSDVYSRRLDATIRGAIGPCAVTPLRYADAPTNLVYVCRPDQPSPNGRYTDERNPATYDFWKARLR